MKLLLNSGLLGAVWLMVGVLGVTGGLGALAGACVINSKEIVMNTNQLPMPLDFVVRNLGTIGAVQSGLGLLLALGGFLLMRRKSIGRLLVQAGSITLIGWVVFLAGQSLVTARTSAVRGGEAADPSFALLISGIWVLLLCMSIWALSRPSIGRELVDNQSSPTSR